MRYRKKSKPIVRKIWRYSLADFDRAAELLDSIEWEQVLPDDVELFWAAMKSYFLQVMEICVPHAMSLIKCRKNIPWMNSTISKKLRRETPSFLLPLALENQLTELSTTPSGIKLFL